jgi:uncharacterized Zn finger protein (UPF0148 family)
MKACERCGIEIDTFDGENRCQSCEEKSSKVRGRKRATKNMMEEALRDCGLVKVRGALGGVYWE